jgi:hypothetical protein
MMLTTLSRELETRAKGSKYWLEEAERDIVRMQSTPRAFLTQLNQKKQFQVVHSRGKIHTPNTEDTESALEDTWLAFTGNTTDTAVPSIICLGKSPKTAKLFTEKAALLTSIPASKTGCFSGAKSHHQKFTAVPSLLTLPWK